jgi:ribonuclease R
MHILLHKKGDINHYFMGRKKKNAKARDIKSNLLHILGKSGESAHSFSDIFKMVSASGVYSRNMVQSAINALVNCGDMEQEAGGLYKLRLQKSFIVGKVDLTSQGSAFIITDDLPDDVFVSPRNTNKALHGDIVKVALFAQSKGKKQEGEIVEILEEGNRFFVGVIEVSSSFAFVTPNSKNLSFDIFVPLKSLNGAANGQVVRVKITDWPKRAKNPFGEIADVLGMPGENDTEMHAILAEYGLPHKFEQAVENAADAIPDSITEEEIAKRKDMRKITTFTIDPHDAKDFDDALSVEKLENGNTLVGIHIADVTHYVQEGTVLEDEAYQRATSVYLVDRVVPMLPERLSNNVCSLRPNEDKLCFSAIFELTPDANVLTQWFGRTIINSDRRFAYEEAQEVIETGEGDLKDEILLLDGLAKKLRAQRFQKGAIAFDKQEVKFELGDNGKPLGIYFKESKDANKLIEEFMLLANKRVAEYVANKLGNKTFVYRIHDKPDTDKLAAFAKFVKKFGYKMSIGSAMEISKSMNSLLEQAKTSPHRDIIESLAVRSMAKAIYSVTNIGHYGLAFTHYSHFTSPIRRYPDMMVHRLLAKYLDGKGAANEEDYQKRCKHSSEMEQKASNAERSSIKYKQVEFMQDKSGMEFDGVISGVTEWGLYVEIIENKCEGMVPIKHLADDFYVFDDKNFCIRGKRTKKEHRLGDKVRVKVLRSDLMKKQLDFTLLQD